MEFLRIASDLIISYIALLIITKILGKTQITQITAFDFISALVLGELVGNALYDDKIGLSRILFAVVLWGTLIYVTEIITQKKKGFRSILEGKPSIIIAKGKILREQMEQNKLDINQLQHLLRAKDVFSIREVEYAVLETDGTVSVLKKSTYAQLTRQDHHIPKQSIHLPVTLISDGEVIWDNLKESGFSEEWLQNKSSNLVQKSIKMYFMRNGKKERGCMSKRINSW